MRDVVRKLCEGVTDPEELIKEIHSRITNRHGRETILAALVGVVSDAEKDTMRQLRDELDLAEKHKQECMDKMLHICKTYYPEEHLCGGLYPVCKLTSDMGGNESQFEPTARRGKYYSKHGS